MRESQLGPSPFERLNMTVLTNVVNCSYEGLLLLLKAIQRSQDIRGEQRARYFKKH
jgi:hypothetical protein